MPASNAFHGSVPSGGRWNPIELAADSTFERRDKAVLPSG